MRWDVYKMENLEGEPAKGVTGKTILAILFIVGLTALHTYVNFVWQRGTGFFTQPPAQEQAVFLGQVKVLHEMVSTEGPQGILRFYKVAGPTASPFLALFALPLTLLFGLGPMLIVVFLIPFTFVFFLATFLLGKRIFGQSAGVFAAVLLLALPAFTLASRTFSVNYPAAALYTLGLYFLLRSGFFRSTGSSILFGVLAGLSFLCRIEGGILFLVPAVIGLALLVRRGDRVRRLRNIVLSFFVSAIIGGSWFLTQHAPREVLGYAKFLLGQGRSYASSGLPRIMEVGNTYLAETVNRLASFPVVAFIFLVTVGTLVILTLSVFTRIFKKRLPGRVSPAKRGWAFILAILLGSAALLALHFPSPQARYILPLSGLIAVAAGRLALAFPLRKIAKPVIVFLLIIVLFNYIMLERGIRLIPKEVSLGQFLVYRQEGYIHHQKKAPEELPAEEGEKEELPVG